MANTFSFHSDGEKIIGTLYSLDEYEADGGDYDDTGNGGESWDEGERKEFLAALTLKTDDGDDCESPYIAGLKPEDVWLDTTTGYWLIRDWPAEAPLESRMVNSR